MGLMACACAPLTFAPAAQRQRCILCPSRARAPLARVEQLDGGSSGARRVSVLCQPSIVQNMKHRMENSFCLMMFLLLSAASVLC